jgi:filamentous hemagglutinin family protein
MNRHASMNRVYRLIWNEAVGAFVPAAETARGRGKAAKRKLFAIAATLSATMVQAGPTGGQVTAGNGNITQSGSTTTIQQSSQNLALNWQTFNITSRETVDFVQPNTTAVAVNRILDPNGSVILGHLNANGQVFLINPNGVIFGKGAEVNVGGLVASTLDIVPSGGGSTKTFSGVGSGSVVNEGTITAASGGTVVLLGNHVGNTGTISAQLGSVALGAGSAATLTFSGTRLVSMQVDQSVLNSEASNGGLIRTDGGAVLMTAGAQKSLLASVVNNTGVIEARTVASHDGTITLLGGMSAGTVNDSGTLDASAPNGGSGGSIDTSAAHVQIANSAKITTAAAMGLNGTWTIDPDGFTIASTGGDVTGAALTAALADGNVNIASTSGSGSGSDGNVNVDDTVSWSTNRLALIATNDVNINAVITAAGTASLDLAPGSNNVNVGFNPNGTFAGSVNFSGTGVLRMNVNGALHVFTVINSLGTAADATNGGNTLQGIAAAANTHGYFALGSNIDASAVATWNSCTACSASFGAGHYGFRPIGYQVGSNTAPAFNGVFDGLGHTVTSLYESQAFNPALQVTTPATYYIGLFGATVSSSVIRNVGMVNDNVLGGFNVGGLVGSNSGLIGNSYATGAVRGNESVGGLAGTNYGKLNNGHSTVAVSDAPGDSNNGELFGGLVGSGWSGSISNSYASGAVSASSYVGGLVGIGDGVIANSYATGSVTAAGSSGQAMAGGLVGNAGKFSPLFSNIIGSIANSYATGNVTANGLTAVGGLVGKTSYGETIVQSHATGTVAGGNATGGLVGLNSGGPISNSYATGSVTSAASSTGTGGLVGSSYGNVTNSYATGSVSGTSDVGGLAGANYGGVFSSSHATGNVTGSGQVGGLVGVNYGPVSQSYATGAVSGASSVGGLVGGNKNYGSATGAVTQSYATGSVTGTGNNVGGLVGANYGTITLSYATSAATGTAYDVGGLVGANYGAGSIATSYATGIVSGTHDAGGLIGLNYGSISNSHAAVGSVTGTSGVGGLVGHNYGSVITSYATGNVTGTGNVGGLVGNGVSGSSISNSYATGSVAGTVSTGGLVGLNYGNASIDHSYATGSVTGGRYTGGLVGANYGMVSNTYATGSVSGTLNVGGLIGANQTAGTVSNSYASGLVTGGNFVGALIGANLGTLSNSFYNSTVDSSLTGIGGNNTGTANVAGTVMGMSAANMQIQGNFTSAQAANGGVNPGWDLNINAAGTSAWFMYEGETAPLLRVLHDAAHGDRHGHANLQRCRVCADHQQLDVFDRSR